MYKSFSEEIIEEVRLNNDIVEVVSEYVKLDRKGKNFFGLCPFHKEKTPSFSVVPSSQYFHCFGCGKGGNVIHFIMNCENLDFVEAIKFLADRARISLPEGESSEEKELAMFKKKIIEINTETARYFFNSLKEVQGLNARKYLSDRGISEQILKKFGIGYSCGERDILYKYLLEKGFDELAIIKSGLVLSNKNGGYYDRFRNRIMYPIFDVRGNIIAFGGRVIDNSKPKYMNSPETLAYSKGKNLYALNYAKNSGEKRLVVVEGYMDAISMHQYGITNSVASLGTALTESQGRILKKYAEEIIISYDADTAGQAATLRGLDLLNDIGCNVKVLIIPKAKDPDEYIRKKGPDAFRKLIDNSLTLVDYKVRTIRSESNTDTVDGKIHFLNRVADLLSKIDNQVEREMYVTKLAKEYGISEESIFSEIYKRVKPRTNLRAAIVSNRNIKKSVNNREMPSNRIIHDERFILSLICVDNRLYSILKEFLKIDDFSSEDNKRIASIIFDRLDNKKDITSAELMNILESDTASDFAKIINEECHCDDSKKAVMEIIKRLRGYKIEERKREVLELLKNANSLKEGDVEKLKIELNSLVMLGRKIYL